jgi:metal-dependent amidase/aminoacylase/carboxypeptidase family protein
MESAKTGEYARKEEHHQIIKAAGCNIDTLIGFRRDIHQHAELGFKEFRTS